MTFLTLIFFSRLLYQILPRMGNYYLFKSIDKYLIQKQ